MVFKTFILTVIYNVEKGIQGITMVLISQVIRYPGNIQVILTWDMGRIVLVVAIK